MIFDLTQMPDTETPAAINNPPRFKFLQYWIDHVSFETLPPEAPDEGERRPSSSGCKTVFGADATVDPEKSTCELRLRSRFTGHPKWQPYRLDLVVVGRFSMSEGAAEDLDLFTKTNAPAVLFPFLREAAHRITRDGKYGPIRVDPVNIAALFAKQWQRGGDTETGSPTPTESVSDAN